MISSYPIAKNYLKSLNCDAIIWCRTLVEAIEANFSKVNLHQVKKFFQVTCTIIEKITRFLD